MSATVAEFSLRQAYAVRYRLSGDAHEGATFRYFFNDEHAARESVMLADAFGWASVRFERMTPEECEAQRVPHRVRVVS